MTSKTDQTVIDFSACRTGDLVSSIKHVLLTHAIIWAVYRQLTARWRPKKKKIVVSCPRCEQADTSERVAQLCFIATSGRMAVGWP